MDNNGTKIEDSAEAATAGKDESKKETEKPAAPAAVAAPVQKQVAATATAAVEKQETKTPP